MDLFRLDEAPDLTRDHTSPPKAKLKGSLNSKLDLDLV